MKRQTVIVCAAVVVFFAALAFTLYPLISSAYNAKHHAEIQSRYESELLAVDTSDLDAAREAATAYNAALAAIAKTAPYTDSTLESAADGYAELLNITGSGIMGYIRIPTLNLSLPIFHGTDDVTLERGVGHLLGSSLPVGGENTHAVLTGHSGLSSQPMFSDLEDLVVGDIFYVEVLNETLCYQVDQIVTVLPTDSSNLCIESGKDLVTLITCTPFGVNSHRLLVRGTRVDMPEEEAEAEITTQAHESTWERKYVTGIFAGLATVLVVCVCTLVFVVFHRRRSGKYEK